MESIQIATIAQRNYRNSKCWKSEFQFSDSPDIRILKKKSNRNLWNQKWNRNSAYDGGPRNWNQKLEFPTKLTITSFAWMQRFVMISPGEYCLTPPRHGNPFTNLMIYITIRTTIMPSTRSKGKLCLREQFFSLRKWIFCSIRSQCWDAAIQFTLGAPGRLPANSVRAANSWSLTKQQFWNPFASTFCMSNKELPRYAPYWEDKAMGQGATLNAVEDYWPWPGRSPMVGPPLFVMIK